MTFENKPKEPEIISILGLDVGDKRVGVAFGHLASGVSTPLGVYNRSNGEAERNIISLVKEKGVQLVVVGMPLNEDGRPGEQCRKIEKFCRRLRNRIPVRIGYVDEYASSAEASELISSVASSGAKKKFGKGAIDALSAMIIVKNYISTGSCIEIEFHDSDLEDIVENPRLEE